MIFRLLDGVVRGARPQEPESCLREAWAHQRNALLAIHRPVAAEPTETGSIELVCAHDRWLWPCPSASAMGVQA